MRFYYEMRILEKKVLAVDRGARPQENPKLDNK